MNRTTKFPWIRRFLVLVVTLSPCHLVTLSSSASAQQRELVSTAPEPTPQQPPANNWFNVDTPGVAALARPASLIQYGPGPGGGRADGCCHDCHPQGCLLKKILLWATYCPKERVCCSNSFCCNSCQYKGVVPFYLFYLNPHCVEGTGLHATFTQPCYRGCNGCAAAGTCGQP
jgi:hypothetical protein